MYISTGAGALNQLPNDKVEAILSRMRPPLRAAEYDEAVEQAVVDIGLGLAGQGAEPIQGFTSQSRPLCATFWRLHGA